MTGIFLFFALAVWLLLAVFLTKFFVTKLPENWRGMPIRALVFLGLLPLPLTDEIVGKIQFDRLCQENSTIQVDRAKATGKTVYLDSPPDIQIQGTWVPIRLQHWRYVDATTREPVVSYNILHAKGGRFIRALGISEGNAPLLFHGYCEPGDSVYSRTLFDTYGITYIEPPIKQRGEKK